MICTSRDQRRQLARDNAKLPTALVKIHSREWPANHMPGLIGAFRSRDYLVQVYVAPEPAIVRLSINRTELGDNGRWLQDIPWEELQRLKNEAGYRDNDAIEIYPREVDVVNVANVRHLWIMADPVPFAWRRA